MFVKTSKFMKVLSSESRGEVYFDYAESRKTFVPKELQSDMRVTYNLRQKKIIV